MTAKSDTLQAIAGHLNLLECEWTSKDLRRWDIGAVETIFQVGSDAQAESSKYVEGRFEAELSMLRTLIAGLHYIALSLHTNCADRRIFPADWIHDDLPTNADVILGAALSQLGNYTCSSMDLALRGLDNPARALARSTVDLCQMLTLVVADRATFRAFVIESHTESPKDVWYRFFSEKRLSGKLREVERGIGIPDRVIHAMRAARKEEAEFLSQAVHHSYTALTVGTLVKRPASDTISLSILGATSDASGFTLNVLLRNLMQFLLSFRAALCQQQLFPGTSALQEYWENGWLLVLAVTQPYMEWIKASYSAR